ncbi:MAG: CvpA family protein [Rikenellaceae bacterium]|nr:CvpA family protein [Rikenellaceae bacterium]
MTVLDIILLLLLLYALYTGVKRGFIAQLGGIVAIVAGIWLACRYSEAVGAWLGIDPEVARYVAFALIVIACILLIGGIGWCLGKMFHLIGLGFLNRLGGVILSLAKMTLILGALLMAFGQINNHTQLVSPQQFERSLLYGPVVRVTGFALPFLKKAVEVIDFVPEE